MSTSIADVISSPDSWFFYNDENGTIDNSLGSFVNGPSTAPLGVGSVQISVSGTQRRNLATYQFSGQILSEITDLKYSTYNPSSGNGGSVNRSGYINFNVDFNGSDTCQTRLIFLPTDNGTVMQDTWQEWDAINSGNALWRYSGSIWPGTAISGITTFDFEPFVRSAEILNPTVGQKVSGNVSFDAVLHDKDKDDNVQWAVRAGTCATHWYRFW